MSWNQLLSILESSVDDIEEQLREPPIACPEDGEPLRAARGVLHCRYCGFTHDGSSG